MTPVDDTNSYKRPNSGTTISHVVEEEVETQRVWNFQHPGPPVPRGLSTCISISTNDQAHICFPKQGTPIKPHRLFGRPQGFLTASHISVLSLLPLG